MPSRTTRDISIVAAVYALLVVALLSVKPLWTDEVVQLVTASPATLGEVIERTPSNPGAVPLGYVAQHYSLKLAGDSVWGARLPAALFGVASVLAIGVLAWQFGLAQPWLAAALFAILPLTLRYSAEARPYSQAIFLSIVLTVLFLGLAQRTGPARAGAYALGLALTLYTQPFAALVAGAHFLWALLYRKWKLAAWCGIAAVVAGAAFVPWFVWARPRWAASIAAKEWHFVFTARTPLMLFREFTGAGYVGSGILLVLGILAVTRARLDRRRLALVLLMIAVPLAGGLIADAAADYFLASRQFLWALPACAILAACELEKRSRAAVLCAVVLVIGCAYSSVKRFTAVEENWQAAAQALAAEVDRGACLSVAPPEARLLYAYFEPRLARDSGDCRTVVAAVAPHTSEKDRTALFQGLSSNGYTEQRTERVGGTSVLLWEK